MSVLRGSGSHSENVGVGGPAASTTGTNELRSSRQRSGHELAVQLPANVETMGLKGRSEIVTAALQLLHRQAAEARMARSVDDFCCEARCAWPIGVLGDRLDGPAGRGRSAADGLEAHYRVSTNGAWSKVLKALRILAESRRTSEADGLASG